MSPRVSRIALGFRPDIVRLCLEEPSPLPRAVLYGLITLLSAGVLWACFGKLDIVVVTHGKLVPLSFLKIVQPAEAGIVSEILVAEGDAVQEGQVLVRMDARPADADLKSVVADLARTRLQLRRIDAELAGVVFTAATHDPPETAAQVQAQLRARRQAYFDARDAEQALRARAEHDLLSASEIESKLVQTAPLYREQERAWEQLAAEGFAGRLMALDRRRSRIEIEQELRAQSRTVEGLRATIAQADKRIAQIDSNYRKQLHDERAEAERAHTKLQQEWEKQQHRRRLLELRAPQSGIVKDLATHTPGTVLSPGTIVATLVPRDEPLLAEVWVANADAGFVRPGQPARVKLATYPFQKYGTLRGSVKQVGPDAQSKPAAVAEGRPAQTSELAYRALIALDGHHLAARGDQLRLSAGMIVTAEVHLGTRSVLEYLLSPIQKVAAEASRER